MAKKPALVKTKPSPKMKTPTKPKKPPTKLATKKTKNAKKDTGVHSPSVYDLLKKEREKYLEEERVEWEMYYARRVRYRKPCK